MARNVEFDPAFFKDILNSEGVANLCQSMAEEMHKVAVANAPVDSGAYRDGLQVRRVRVKDRVGYIVAGTDSKTLLVESKTGNLARAARAVNRGR